MKYEIIESVIDDSKIIINIKSTDNDGNVLFIPIDESNADYQQYLIDTDGGLLIPEEPK